MPPGALRRELVIHGGSPQVVEGSVAYDVIVTGFTDADGAQKWYDSPAYPAAGGTAAHLRPKGGPALPRRERGSAYPGPPLSCGGGDLMVWSTSIMAHGGSDEV